MSGLNPNFVLAAVVAVLLLAVGAFVAVFVAGGSDAAVLARVGIITALVAPTITSLVALLATNRQGAAVAEVKAVTNGHADVLEAQQARIAFLEAQAEAGGTAPASQPPVGGP